MKHSFLLCGATGCCIEVLWTGLHSYLQKDFHLTGQSSIWMFPIYGMAAVIRPLSSALGKCNALIRGSVYTAAIFATEYSTGRLLKRHHLCPWDYSSAPLNVQGLIRLDYAPLWFVTGLFYEKLLKVKP